MTAAEEVVVVKNDIGIVKDEADDNEVSGESIGQAEGSLGIDVEDDTVELRQLKWKRIRDWCWQRTGAVDKGISEMYVIRWKACHLKVSTQAKKILQN